MAVDSVDAERQGREFRDGKRLDYERKVAQRGHEPIPLWLGMKDDGSQAAEQTAEMMKAADAIGPSTEPKVTSMGLPNFEGLVEAMDKLEFSLESEASKFHGEIAALGPRGLAAIQKGRDRMKGVGDRITRVEQFVSKLEGANGGAVGNSSGQSSATGTEVKTA
jgi:hypothetical protein